MTTSRASVVIPVYNEAGTLPALLSSLSVDAAHLACRIIVVCNGCVDDSVDVARAFADVEVVELTDASKVGALNLGDDVAGDDFPRLYADGDIVFEPGALGRLLDELRATEPVAVGPEVRYLTDDAPWLVRGYYYGLVTMPRRAAWRSTHLAGRGLYGANQEGRAAFGRFPALRADDAFFDAQFDETQRRIVRDAVVRINVPTSVQALVRNVARVTDANRELAATGGSNEANPTPRAISDRVRRTIGLWRASPLVRQFHGPSTISSLSAYAIVRVMAFGYRWWLALSHREVRWR